MKKLLTRLCPALLISISAILAWSGLTNGHNWGDDFSAYIMQAKSITEGKPSEFIEANRFTIERSSSFLGPVAYPWGFPALLAPFYALFGLNMIALKSVVVVSFLLFLLLLWSGFRKYHSDSWRAVMLCLFAINPTLLGFTDQILSDIPFLLVSTSSVLLIGRVVIEKRRLISPVCDQLLLGASMVAAFFIRANGILLLITLGITQCLLLIRSVYGLDAQHKRAAGLRIRPFSTKHAALRHLALNTLPYVFFAGVVLAWQALLPAGGSFYLSAFMDGVSMALIKHNAEYYVNVAAAFFDGVPYSYLLYGVTIPLAVTGAISRYRSDYHIIIFIVLTFLLYIPWSQQFTINISQSLRFLFPILPFYISFVLSSLERYTVGVVEPEPLLRKLICIVPTVLILLYFGRQSASHAFANLMRNRESVSGPFVETSLSMFSYIKDNTPSESTVVFFKPRAMRMMTGRRSLMINKVGELSPGDYLSLYQRDAESRDQQVSADSVRCLTEKGTIQRVYKNRDFVVYRLTEAQNNAFRTPACEASLAKSVAGKHLAGMHYATSHLLR